MQGYRKAQLRQIRIAKTATTCIATQTNNATPTRMHRERQKMDENGNRERETWEMSRGS
jgi:hypothetical protein